MNINAKSMELILKKLDAVYGQGKAADKDAVSGYVIALGKYSRIQVARAAMAAVQVGTFYPRPAEIIKQIDKDCEMREMYRNAFDDPHDPFDEACMWLMFVRGYTSPDEITEADMRMAADSAGYKLQAQGCVLVSQCIADGYENYQPA